MSETLEQKVERMKLEVRDALTSLKRAEQEHAFADGAYRDAIGFVAAAEAELAKARKATRTVGQDIAERVIGFRWTEKSPSGWQRQEPYLANTFDGLVREIDAALATAREEERARCLKLAEIVHTACPYDSVRKLVAAIRAGRSPC